MKITKTPRGFHQYGSKVTDSYGNKFSVQESSAAWGPHVWIFIEPSPEIKDGNCLHLNEDQAKKLLKRLQVWLDEIPERWSACEPEPEGTLKLEREG